MSKQQTEAYTYLKMLFADIKSETTLDKITNNCLHKGIRVDIWIPSKNLVVEIHGIQHHKPSGFGKSKINTLIDFNKQQNRDDRLIRICKQFGINYEQIDYNEKVSFIYIFNKFNKYVTSEEDDTE